MADILCRIFTLKDVFENTGNFGFIRDKAEHFKLIDFTVLSFKHYENWEEVFLDWKSGNHKYNFKNKYTL